jgi:hypothetical protein
VEQAPFALSRTTLRSADVFWGWRKSSPRRRRRRRCQAQRIIIDGAEIYGAVRLVDDAACHAAILFDDTRKVIKTFIDDTTRGESITRPRGGARVNSSDNHDMLPSDFSSLDGSFQYFLRFEWQ